MSMRQMECCSEENIRLVERNVTLRTPSLDASAAAIPNVRVLCACYPTTTKS